ncbi:MAG: hypothetical protein WC843_03855 [Candidatus Gracilibacteria bacterium]|jgi:hypothetical protein
MTFSKNLEINSSEPSPEHLLEELNKIGDPKKMNFYLRKFFLEISDVDEYASKIGITAQEDFTVKQVNELLGYLENFKVYLKSYLEETKGRIERLEEIQKTGKRLLRSDSEEVVTPAMRRRLNKVNQRVSKAMGAAFKSNSKGKSLYSVTQKSTEPLRDDAEKDLMDFVEQLPFNKFEKEKILKLVAGYDDAVFSAKELDPEIYVPTKEQVIRKIMALSPQQLKNIINVMRTPELVISPARQSPKKLVQNMNLQGNRHQILGISMQFLNNRGGEPTLIYLEPTKIQDDSSGWSGPLERCEVSICDGVDSPARNFDENSHDYLKEHGLRLIKDYEYLGLTQKSLKRYEGQYWSVAKHELPPIIDRTESDCTALDGSEEFKLDSNVKVGFLDADNVRITLTGVTKVEYVDLVDNRKRWFVKVGEGKKDVKMRAAYTLM